MRAIAWCTDKFTGITIRVKKRKEKNYFMSRCAQEDYEIIQTLLI